MNRFLVFAYYHYYPNGGAQDAEAACVNSSWAMRVGDICLREKDAAHIAVIQDEALVIVAVKNRGEDHWTQPHPNRDKAPEWEKYETQE